MMRLMPADRRFAEAAEQLLQRFVTEKIKAFFGHLKFDVSRQRFADLALALAILHLAALFGGTSLRLR